MSKAEKVFNYIILYVIAIVIICGCVSVGAVASMILCNWILPVFDLGYPITFKQGCGIGTIILLVVASGFYHHECYHERK